MLALLLAGCTLGERPHRCNGLGTGHGSPFWRTPNVSAYEDTRPEAVALRAVQSR